MPAKDYNALSGLTRSNQKRHKELQRPVGTWSQNKVFITLDRNKDTQLLQVMKRVTFISKQIEPN